MLSETFNHTSTKGNQFRLVGQSMIDTDNPVVNKWKSNKFIPREAFTFHPKIIHRV